MIREMSNEPLPAGVLHLPGYFDRPAQEALLVEVRAIVAKAPLYTPAMPRTGRKMSVRMTNCGPLGWVTDKENGYRYQAEHPVTGRPWPAIPESLLELWHAVSGDDRGPQACLINFYDAKARMGLHQDRDEEDFSAPVVSVSLGDSCLFRIGGLKRNDSTQSFHLQSGDVMMLRDEGRLRFHGVDRIHAGSSDLLKNGGRINLTLRRVTV